MCRDGVGSEPLCVCQLTFDQLFWADKALDAEGLRDALKVQGGLLSEQEWRENERVRRIERARLHVLSSRLSKQG